MALLQGALCLWGAYLLKQQGEQMREGCDQDQYVMAEKWRGNAVV